HQNRNRDRRRRYAQDADLEDSRQDGRPYQRLPDIRLPGCLGIFGKKDRKTIVRRVTVLCRHGMIPPPVALGSPVPSQRGRKAAIAATFEEKSWFHWDCGTAGSWRKYTPRALLSRQSTDADLDRREISSEILDVLVGQGRRDHRHRVVLSRSGFIRL